MPDYQNAKIYKLWSTEGKEIYIGSTTIALSRRKVQHVCDFKSGKSVTSKILFEKYNDVRIELLECFPCNNKEELTKKEGEHIRNNECVNRRVAGRTRAEYYQNNKNELIEQKREYYQSNKDMINLKRREYHKENKDMINQKSREYMREYYKKNKDMLNQKQRERYRLKKE